MGMDIHCFLEEYDESTQKWDLVKDYIYKGYDKSERVKDFWDDRSYSTFAWLGCNYRSKSIQPINQPRGLPKDISEKLYKLQHYWFDGDCHDYSWFTFDELLDYFEIPVYCESYFSQDYLNYLKREGKEVWQDEKWYNQCRCDGIETKWTAPIDEIVNNDFIDKVKETSKGKNPKHLRIVFWFDN